MLHTSDEELGKCSEGNKVVEKYTSVDLKKYWVFPSHLPACHSKWIFFRASRFQNSLVHDFLEYFTKLRQLPLVRHPLLFLLGTCLNGEKVFPIPGHNEYFVLWPMIYVWRAA